MPMLIEGFTEEISALFMNDPRQSVGSQKGIRAHGTFLSSKDRVERIFFIRGESSTSRRTARLPQTISQKEIFFGHTSSRTVSLSGIPANSLAMATARERPPISSTSPSSRACAPVQTRPLPKA